MTRDLIRAGQLLKIEVLDHVILGHRTTGREIWEQTERSVRHFVATLGTSGQVDLFTTRQQLDCPDLAQVGGGRMAGGASSSGRTTFSRRPVNLNGLE